MKKSLRILLLAGFAVSIFALVGWTAFAPMLTEVTPTVTQEDKRLDHEIIKFTATTSLANPDTIVIQNRLGRKFYIGHLGSRADSAITVQLSSAEASLDSIRHTLEFQVSNKLSPSAAIANTTDWFTAQTTSGAGSALDSIAANVVQFIPGRTGDFIWFRLLIRESSTAKDASQTLTGYINIPRPTVPQR